MKRILFIILLLAFISWSANAQTISFNLLQTPCNNDGVLVIQTSGITFPFFLYDNFTGNYTTMNSANDTIFNYDGSAVHAGATYVIGSNLIASATFSQHYSFTDSIYSPPTTCPAINVTTAYVLGGGTAPFVVEWYEYTNTSGGGTVFSLIALGNPVSLPTGFYYTKITDANGCFSWSNGDSVYNFSPVNFFVSTTPANCTNGTATVNGLFGGTPPYTYFWSNGAITPSISGLMSGMYAVTATDAQGCDKTIHTYVTQTPVINDTSVVTPATCLANDGSVITFGSGGVPPYSYLWNTGQTTQTIFGLISGYYSVTVTDANSCIGNGSAFVNPSTPITVTNSTTTSLCTAATGTATLNISGGTPPYSVVWNTFPAQSGTTAINLAEGQYSFIVTDAVGCERSGIVYISPVSSIYAYIVQNNAVCLQANGSAIINVWGSPPFTYLWNTGATTPSVSGLNAGSYNCTVTDNMGCSVTKSTIVSSSSPIALNFSSTPASCIYTANGTATVNATGGTAPYTYYWLSGATTATAAALSTGWYWLTVHDAAGCVQTGQCFVNYNAANTSCYCTVSGYVYEDSNTNCIMDVGETGIQNIRIHLSGYGYVYTDATGYYSFIVPSGTYTLSENVGNYYPLAGCQNNNISVTTVATSGCTITNNFANVINPIHDIGIYTTYYNSPPIPGNAYSQNVIVKNNGTLTESAVQLGYKHDGQIGYSTVNPNLFIQQNSALAPDWYSITSSFPTLAPGATQSFNVQYNVPTNIPIGTSLLFNDTAVYSAPMSNWLTDYTPWNNVSVYNTNVVGSWDPNEKEVSPKGYGTEGYITQNDSVLTYTVHFENTGSYYAQNIYVIDTLDSHLNLNTLEPVYSDHPFTTTVSETGVVKFTFKNIHLPYYNPFSTGEIIYTIHMKPNLPDLTQIKNNADIYFDYNAPVRTNTTLNTLSHYAGVTSINSEDNVTIYPNPSTGIFTLISSNKVSSINIYNVLGERIFQSTIKQYSNVTIDLSNQAKGIYFVKIEDENKSVVNKKIVVQ